MNLIRKRKNGKRTTWIYTDGALADAASAVKYLTGTASSADFEAQYIALRDLAHSADEGNTSRQMKPDTDAGDILEALTAQPYNRIFLSGKYRGVRAGIGISLRTFELSVTLPDDRPDLAEALTAWPAGSTR